MFYLEKIALARQVMIDEDIDCWIVAGHETLTNSEPILPIISDHEFIGYTALIFCRDGSSKCICTPIDRNGYVHAGIFDDVEGFELSFEESLGNYLKEKQPKVIALDYSEEDPSCDGLSYGCYLYIEDALKASAIDYQLVSANKIIKVVKGVKSARELALIEEACRITQEIFDEAKDFIKAGVNCREIAKFFQDATDGRGLEYSWPKAYNPGVFSGVDCPRGHMGAPDVVVKPGDLVNVDFGVRYQGYSSDMQRMYYVAVAGEKEIPDTAIKAFNAVRDTISESAKALKPGVLGIDIDAYAREVLQAMGFPSWDSALGHGIGTYAHDGGQLLGPERVGQKRDELIRTAILENTCFTLEPSAMCDCGMVGIEEVVVVKEDGAIFLSAPQQDIYRID